MCNNLIDHVSKQIVCLTQENGGASVTLRGVDLSGSAAYAVSVYPERGRTLIGLPTIDNIVGFIEDNCDVLRDESGGAKPFVGTWVQAGFTYLDISVAVESEAEALELARQCQQLAVFDLKRKADVYV